MQTPINTSYNVVSLGMGSDTNVTAVKAPNKLLCTHNGGSSFDTATVNDIWLTDVFFVSSTKAFAAGKSIWKTTDGGHNWAKLYDFADSSIWSTLHFLDEQTGWVIRTDGLYKTSNGGLSWQLINATPGECVFFVNPNHGFFSDKNKIFSTTDGGITWNSVYTGQHIYHDIHFVSDSIGYITDYDKILKTTDGGINWTTVVKIVNGSLIELHFTDANHGWACGTALLKYEQ